MLTPCLSTRVSGIMLIRVSQLTKVCKSTTALKFAACFGVWLLPCSNTLQTAAHRPAATGGPTTAESLGTLHPLLRGGGSLLLLGQASWHGASPTSSHKIQRFGKGPSCKRRGNQLMVSFSHLSLAQVSSGPASPGVLVQSQLACRSLGI